MSFGLFSVKGDIIPSEINSDYILLINPDAESCAWGHMLIPSIQDELIKRYPGLEVKVEYMYSLGITSEEGVNDFKTSLFKKYATPPKYLMLFESDSYGVLHEEIDRNWGENVPTLLLTREDFIGDLSYYIEKKAIPEAEKTYLKDIAESRNNLTVIYNLFDIPGSIAIMKQMFPDMNKLVFVTDNRYISAENRAEVERTVKANYPGMTVENLTPDKLTTDQLITKFLETEKRSKILYFTWFNNELTGDKDLILQTNAYRIFSLYVSSPVFTINDVGLKESGMLGGSYTRYEQVMSTTLSAIDDIIAGKPLKKTIFPPVPVPTFNYLAMLNHGIKESALPSGSYLYNRPLSFLERNRNLILGLAVILGLSFILMRVILLLKTRKMQDKEIKLLEKYSDLFNNMPIGYQQEQLIYNAAGEPVDYIVKDVNPSFEEQLTAKEEVLGIKGSETNPEIIPELMSLFKTLIKDRNKKINLAYYHKQTDRYFSLIMSMSSTPDCIDMFFVDNTELYKTQRLLQTVNNKLSMSIDIANITPWRWDLENKTILCDVNKPIELGANTTLREEKTITIPQHDYLCRIHDEDRPGVKQNYYELLEGRTNNIRCEFRIANTNRHGITTWDWVEVRATVEKRDENGQPAILMGSSVTITDRKNIEQELLQAKEKAEESNRLKSAFLANMSHEIRTPLNAIVGFSNILATTDTEEDKKEYVKIIENNNNVLLQLISDILDLSKLEAGTLEFHYSDVDLNTLMEEIREATQDRAAKGVRVLFDNWIPDCYISTEKIRLTQLLSNMLSNANKFTTEGEIRFGYKLHPGNKLYFYVSDTGCGISEEQKEKIFGRFVKLNHFVQGTGLGLSLCQMIAQRMDGEIGVESEVGKGTTFWFTIPFLPASTTKVSSVYPGSTQKEKPKVLIAEDNISNYELFEAILQNDYHIIHAWNGEEAVDMFIKHQPNLVLMDINMPKMNGYEATVELRKMSKDVPIIAVTAYAFSTDETQIKRNGFSGYIPKPLNPQKLRNHISDLLRDQAAFL